MTLAEIRTAIRNLSRNQSTATGTLFPSDNVFIDFIINMATEAVVVDLVDWMPDIFLATENITLVSGTADYALTAEWLQIISVKKNVSGENPTQLTFYSTQHEYLAQYVGESNTEPDAWTLKGNTIVIMPTPGAAVASYLKVWFTRPEVATMVTAGPSYIPRMAHRLIPLMAMIMIANTLEAKVGTRWEKLYEYWLKKIQELLFFRVQQQPKFLNPSYVEGSLLDSRDPAYFDRIGFLG
jgi:hypothetical protein